MGYGTWLQKFLLERAPVECIIDNHAQRSFDAADVNTIISVIHAPIKERRRRVDENHLVKFVAFKKPFDEALYTENLLGIEDATEVVSSDVFRVYPISAAALIEAGTEYGNEEGEAMKLGKYVGDKWGGKYLKAPDLFFRLVIERGRPLLQQLSKVADVFGYVHDNNTGTGYPLTSFIKSIKNTRKILLSGTDNEVVQFGVKDDAVSRMFSPILVARTFGQDHLVICNLDGVIGKEFYRVVPKEKHERNSLAVFMNSTFFILERELFGITNLGGGALKLSSNDVRSFLIPSRKLEFQDRVIKEFMVRPIQSVFDECGIDLKSKTPIEEQEPNPLPDRAALDKIVFDALDLTEDERKDVYRAVCRLVWNRISKAKSV